MKLLPEMVLEHLVLSVLPPALLVREGCLVLGWASPPPSVSIFIFFCFGAEFERNHAGDEKSLLSAQPQSCMEPHGGKLPLNGFPCWQTTGLSCLRLTKAPNHLDWGVWHWWLSHPDPSESLLKALRGFLESNSEEPFLLGTHRNQLSPFLPIYELLILAAFPQSSPTPVVPGCWMGRAPQSGAEHPTVGSERVPGHPRHRGAKTKSTAPPARRPLGVLVASQHHGARWKELPCWMGKLRHSIQQEGKKQW